MLVPLDGSADGERAIPTALWLARHFGADIHLLAAEVQRDERAWYQHYLDGVVGSLDGAITHCSDDPDAVRAIRATAGGLDACLVCMATHGRSRSAALVGSTFASAAAGSMSPLVAVGPCVQPRLAPDPRRVVACVDRGPRSNDVVALGAAWARALADSLSIVTVAAGDGQHAFADVRRLALCPDLDDLDVEPLAVLGARGPHAELVRHLMHRPASLLVTATHARAGVTRALAGSEAARIIHASPVPVVTQRLPRPGF